MKLVVLRNSNDMMLNLGKNFLTNTHTMLTCADPRVQRSIVNVGCRVPTISIKPIVARNVEVAGLFVYSWGHLGGLSNWTSGSR